MKKIISTGLLLLILLNLLASCSALRFGATLYDHDDIIEWLDEAFLEENKIGGTVSYPNPNYTDRHGSEPEYIRYPDLPTERTFIITEKEEYEKIFTSSQMDVDFEKEMVILYTSSSVNSIPVDLKEIAIADGVLTISIKFNYPHGPGAVMPYQRFFVLQMKKAEITEVKFERDGW